MARSRRLLLLALLATLAGPWDGPRAASAPLELPHAVLVNLTREDLARIADRSLHDGSDRLRGYRERVNEHVSDLRYDLLFSDSELRLGEDATLYLDVSLLEGSLRVGRFERRFMARRAFCEDLGFDVAPERPVELSLALDLAVEDQDLTIEPRAVEVQADGFQLVRPSRCGRTIVPDWLVWQLGKSRLRRYLADLDALVLDRLRERAEELREDGGFLDRSWGGLRLHPRNVDTSGGSLLVSFAAGRPGDAPTAVAGPPVAPASRRSRSYIGVSESFLNAFAREAFSQLEGTRRGGRDLREVLESAAADALIPGLDALDPDTPVVGRFRFDEPPAVELVTLDAGESSISSGEPATGRAGLRFHLGGIALQIVDERTPDAAPLGTLRVSSATITLAPYQGVLGGISFELVDNDWRIESTGLAFDEELAEATLEELVFGEVFESRQEPLSTDSWRIGRAGFGARYFERSGEWLVIELESEAPASEPAAAAGPAVSVSQANK